MQQQQSTLVAAAVSCNAPMFYSMRNGSVLDSYSLAPNISSVYATVSDGAQLWSLLDPSGPRFVSIWYNASGMVMRNRAATYYDLGFNNSTYRWSLAFAFDGYLYFYRIAAPTNNVPFEQLLMRFDPATNTTLQLNFGISQLNNTYNASSSASLFWST
jgi:hypothetical protein